METLLKREYNNNVGYNDYRDIQSIPLCKGQIWYAELFGVGNVQKGIRPVLIFQNPVADVKSPNVTILSLSSQVEKFARKHLPTQMFLSKNIGLPLDSMVMGETITTISRTQLKDYTGVFLNNNEIKQVERCVMIQLGISLN